MWATAARAGTGFFVALLLLGVLQSQTLTDMMTALVVAGIVPGTALQVPAELTLIAAAGALMLIVANVFKNYQIEAERIRAAKPIIYTPARDPSYHELVPWVFSLAEIWRAFLDGSKDLPLWIYIYAAHFIRAAARAVAATAETAAYDLRRLYALGVRAAKSRHLAMAADSLARAARMSIDYWVKTWNVLAAKIRHYIVRFLYLE